MAITRYQRVAQNVNQMKGCLASGYPFVYGFTVYESFESKSVAKTGVVPMPASGENKCPETEEGFAPSPGGTVRS